MAESYITRKSGGGGIDINGIVESYKVAAGETISAGDFVEFVNKITETNLYSTYKAVDLEPYYISAYLLNETKILLLYHSYSEQLYIKIGTLDVNNNIINFGNENYVDGNASYIAGSKAVVLSETKIILVYKSSDNKGVARIININGNDIVINTASKFSRNSGSNFQNKPFSLIKLSDTKVLAAYLDNYNASGEGVAVIISITNDNISSFNYFLFDNNYDNDIPEVLLLNNQKIVICYIKGSENYIGNVIVGNLDINFTSINWGNKYTFENNRIDVLHAIKLNENKIIISYGGNAINKGSSLIANIDGTNVTFEEKSNFFDS
jgi:hypothetical protein